MRTYEAVFIFRPEEDLYKRGMQLITEEFKKTETIVSKEEDLGIREFAYPIKKEGRGHYHCFYLEGNPESISRLDRTIRLTKEILKHLFIRKDDRARKSGDPPSSSPRDSAVPKESADLKDSVAPKESADPKDSVNPKVSEEIDSVSPGLSATSSSNSLQDKPL